MNSVSGNDNNPGSLAFPLKSFNTIPNNALVIVQQIDEIVINGKTNLLILPSGYTSLPSPSLPNGKSLSPITRILLTNCIDVVISSFSVSASNFVASVTKPSLLGKGITLTSCTRCVVQNCELFSKRSTTGFSAQDWVNNAAGVLIMDGSSNKLFSNHVFNCGGIQLKGSGSIADGNLVENFPTDGLGVWKWGCTVSNNIIRNSHVVNGNHNDLLQVGGGVQNTIITGNSLRAFTDENQPFKNIDCQGIGIFDGSKNILIRGNTVYVAHPIGIWLLGTHNSVIDNNRVEKCGSTWWNSNRMSSISIQPSKSGSPSTSNTVTNNVATDFEIQAGSVTVQSNNLKSTSKKFVTFS